jgi:putative flavoprotein involved in K+ transport
MRLYGHLTGIRGTTLEFADDLAANLDRADAVAEGIKDAIDAHLAVQGVTAPDERRYLPVWEPAEQPRTLDLAEARIGSVVWATGFARDHRWIEVPVFDGRCYPVHWRRATSTPGTRTPASR